MNYSTLLINIEDRIAYVTINRPKALNALNREVFSELEDLFKNQLDPVELSGVIITGAGEKAFVAGADIKEFLSLDIASAEVQAQRGHDLFNLIENFPKPVIAAVNGFALGGGCELAMACHIRIAGEKARFGQPEVNLGILPGYGGTQRLTQLIGKGKAMELMMTSEMIDATTAKSLGLANHVVPQGDEVSRASELIKVIAKKAPLAVGQVIACVNSYYHEGKNGFAQEVKSFGMLAGTADFKEGASAFIEKRKAIFQSK